ncbi:hypothetical protein BX666DRAFT_1929732 [Dichotomocladium elegans]|nr:hypothetical protein BX666DRAFT_1929732 [Dichotomocladium elegans]
MRSSISFLSAAVLLISFIVTVHTSPIGTSSERTHPEEALQRRSPQGAGGLGSGGVPIISNLPLGGIGALFGQGSAQQPPEEA